MKFLKLVALGAAALLACAPSAAQNIATLPNAATLTGAEKMPAAQGTGCATKVQPCASVAISPAAIATYLAPTFQPKDADLDAIAALATQPFGRSLLTQADAAAVRSAIGLGSVDNTADANKVVSSAAKLTTARAINGVAFDGTAPITVNAVDATPRLAAANNLSDLANAATARANLGGVAWAVCKSGIAVSVTGSTTETTQATCTIPAGAAGPNGFAEIMPNFTMSGSGTKTLRVRLGGVEIWNAAPTTQIGVRPVLLFNNANSQSAQFSMNPPNLGVGNATATAMIYRTSVNTAAATALTITCQLATSTETCVLESYLVRITYGA